MSRDLGGAAGHASQNLHLQVFTSSPLVSLITFLQGTRPDNQDLILAFWTLDLSGLHCDWPMSDALDGVLSAPGKSDIR